MKRALLIGTEIELKQYLIDTIDHQLPDKLTVDLKTVKRVTGRKVRSEHSLRLLRF